jgi:hypothetical protein
MSTAYAKSLKDLVNEIKNGQYVIPEIQRSFVWNNEKVEALCESIYNGFPIGSITVWKVEPRFREQCLDLVRPIDMKFKNNMRNMESLVIDGLQRLSSILLIYNGEIELETGKKRINTIYFNPIEEKFKRGRKEMDKKEKYWFHVTDLLNLTAESVLDKKNFDYNFLERQKLIEKINEFRDRFNSYQIGVYVVNWSGDFLDIFEKISKSFTLLNSTGVRVRTPTVFLALLTGKLRKAKYLSFKEQFMKVLSEFEFDWDLDEFVLVRIYMAISTGDYDFNRVRKRLEREDVSKIEEYLDYTKNATKETLSLLKDLGITKSYIQTKYLLVPLTYLVYMDYLNEGKDLNKEKIAYWLILSSLEKRYYGRIYEYLKEDLQAINNGVGVDGLIDNLGVQRVTEDMLRGEFTTAHKLLLLQLYRMNGAKDLDPTKTQRKRIRNIDPEDLEVHHIFPKSLDVPNIDDPCNITLISKEANRILSNKEPAEYLGKFSESELRRHYIPTDKRLWRIENFEEFLEERRKLILEGISEIFGHLYS